jgi:hypothetical protein
MFGAIHPAGPPVLGRADAIEPFCNISKKAMALSG